MKITKVAVNQKRIEAVNGLVMQDYCLYFFRSTVIFGAVGLECTYSGGTAVLYTAGKKQYFRGTAGKGIKYDMVCFQLSAADKQYMADIDIPLDTPVSIPDDFIISSAIKSIKIHSDTSGRRRQEFSELYIRIILIGLEDAHSGIEYENSNISKYPELHELRNNIYDNPQNNWSVERICQKLSVSRTYFHRIYSDTFGTTFMQDVIESRLMYACELLESTDLSISEISEKCGYESDSYFMRQFRQHRGCTPTLYRKKKLVD